MANDFPAGEPVGLGESVKIAPHPQPDEVQAAVVTEKEIILGSCAGVLSAIGSALSDLEGKSGYLTAKWRSVLGFVHGHVSTASDRLTE